jgi:CheY-like chemotaxis protein
VKILVVEDNEITRKLLRVTLRSASYDMLEAADGRSALAMAARERPDLVLQDLKLPDMDGVDLVRQLRELPGCADVPVLAVSGFISRMEEARAVGGLFDEFLVKPVQPSELIRIVEIHLPRSRAGVTGPGAGRRLLLVDDEPVQLKALRAHLELDGFTVLTAHDGIAALELVRSRRVDVVLSDVMMPRLDGFGLCLTIREDKTLADLPIVLFTRRYLDRDDEALARQMGANAFVALGASLAGIGKIVLSALAGQAPRPATGDAGELREKHVYRVISQLERQARINAGLAQRCAAQSAAISVLSTLSTSLSKSFDNPLPVDEMLAACLEAGSFSLAALYLLDADERLVLAGHRGYADAPVGEVETMFGHATLFHTALQTASPIAIPSPATILASPPSSCPAAAPPPPSSCPSSSATSGWASCWLAPTSPICTPTSPSTSPARSRTRSASSSGSVAPSPGWRPPSSSTAKSSSTRWRASCGPPSTAGSWWPTRPWPASSATIRRRRWSSR